MIKGARKQMIVIRTGDSPYFDEAYFVLRSDIDSRRNNRNDILKEANKILADHTDHRPRERSRVWRWVFFGVGILCGAAVAVVLCVLIL